MNDDAVGEITLTVNDAQARTRLPLIASISAGAISQAGSTFTAIAIPWYVLVTTGSATRMGIVGFVELVPFVVSAVLGGALVDRYGYKRISVVADLVSGLSIAAIPLLHDTTGLQFWQLLVLVFFGSVISAPGGTARQSIFPDLIELSGVSLERANGLQGIVRNVNQIAIPPMAGIVIAFAGASQVLWIDAASFFVSATIYWTFVPAISRLRKGAEPYWEQVLFGLQFLRGSQLLSTLLIFAAIINFLFAPLFGLVMTVLAKDAYGSSRALGWMLGAVGVGSLLSLTLFSAIGETWPRRKTIVIGFGFVSAPILIVALAVHLWLAVAALVVCGAGLGPINVIISTVLQEQTPAEMRGRVFGGVAASSLVAAPVGFLTIGGIVSQFGARLTVLGIGVLLCMTAIALGFAPSLRGMDDKLHASTIEDENCSR